MGNKADSERFERATSAAYLLATGCTQAQTASAIGVNPRTIRRYKADPELWDAATEAAHARWLRGVREKAKARLSSMLDTDEASESLVQWVLERLVREFAEGPKRHEVAVAAHVLHDRDPREVLASKLNEIAARQERALPPAESEPEGGSEDENDADSC